VGTETDCFTPLHFVYNAGCKKELKQMLLSLLQLRQL